MKIKLKFNLFLISLFFFPTIIMSFLVAYMFWPEQKDLFLNIGTELIGIAVTVFVIDKLLKKSELQKWSRIRNKLLNNLLRDLLRLIIRFGQNGALKVINKEELQEVNTNVCKSNIENFTTKIIKEDKIFNKEFKSPIVTDLQKYRLVNDELGQCVKRSYQILQSQDYGIQAETEDLVYDFMEISRNYNQWLTTINSQLFDKKPILDRTVSDYWKLIQNEYPNLVKLIVSIIYHINKLEIEIK